MSEAEWIKERELLYAKARQVVADFIGYPFDEIDELCIREATPMQAIEALEAKLKELLEKR
jgi:hypothetical protein